MPPGCRKAKETSMLVVVLVAVERLKRPVCPSGRLVVVERLKRPVCPSGRLVAVERLKRPVCPSARLVARKAKETSMPFW